jgi:hypothetical protein
MRKIWRAPSFFPSPSEPHDGCIDEAVRAEPPKAEVSQEPKVGRLSRPRRLQGAASLGSQDRYFPVGLVAKADSRPVARDDLPEQDFIRIDKCGKERQGVHGTTSNNMYV